jgi:UDP-N-acetylmuramate--alanine ligase
VVTEAILKNGKKALLVNNRSSLPALFKKETQQGDIILMMGARDPSLSEFAEEVLVNL